MKKITALCLSLLFLLACIPVQTGATSTTEEGFPWLAGNVHVDKGRLKGGEFLFALENDRGEVVARGTNSATGRIQFIGRSLNDSDLGEHSYTAYQIQDVSVESAYRLDTRVYNLRLKVVLHSDGSYELIAITAPALSWSNRLK